MKILGLILTTLFCSTLFAGTMDVMEEGSTGAQGAEVRYFKLENEFGKSYLFLLTENNTQACRIPTSMLKDLGIDPIQFGMTLRNVRGTDGVHLTCYMSKEQLGSRLIASRIEVTSWPRP